MARKLFGALALVAVIFAAGCTGPDSGKHRIQVYWKPSTVALLPFERVVPANSLADVVSSPLTGAAYTPGHINKGAESNLDESLAKAVAKYTNFKIISQAELWPVYKKFAGGALADTPYHTLMSIGRALKADALLVGYVYRYQERKEGAGAVDGGATVAFDLALMRVKDGRVLWKTSFDQRQVAFTDNLLNLGVYAKRGLRWLTADEFAAYGMEEIWERSPWTKPALKAKD